MAMEKQHLRNMILGAGHDQPANAPTLAHHELSANQEGASIVAAMPLSYETMVPSQHGDWYHSSCRVMPPPPTAPVGGQDQYTGFLSMAAIDLAKRGVMLEGSPHSLEMIPGCKRKRDELLSPVFGAPHTQQQHTITVDNFLLNHASKMSEALAKQRQRYISLITSTMEDRTAKRLKVMDEEIKCIRGMNWALQEQIRNLNLEAQMWCDIAWSNEAAVNVLRGDLQTALDAQAVNIHGIGDVDDASSCCWGDYHVDFCGDNKYEVCKTAAVPRVGSCKGCGQGEAVVVLLPCRHLCVCVSCAATTRVCPACGCAKTGSININLS
ncbi:unnamed protein product [Alopecurus aequalis]